MAVGGKQTSALRGRKQTRQAAWAELLLFTGCYSKQLLALHRPGASLSLLLLAEEFSLNPSNVGLAALFVLKVWKEIFLYVLLDV